MNFDFIDGIKNNKAYRRFAIIALLLCIGYYILEWINGRAQMADFQVYYNAASAFIHDTQLYGKAFGVSDVGFYKYSPFAALPFIPFALLPYGLASVLYYLFIAVAVVLWQLRLVNYFNQHFNIQVPKKAGLILFVSVLFMADHIERELHLGNVNLFLLIASFFVFTALENGKQTKAGILYGIMLLFKPHFAILIPYFIWKKKWKTLVVTVFTSIAGFLLPALFKGWQGNLEIHSQWLQAMREHNISLEDSANTIYGILNNFVLGGNAGAGLVLILLALCAALFVVLLIRNARQSANNDIRFIEYFTLIAAIPNLAHTDTEHFMWTCPLISYTIYLLINQGVRYYKIVALLMVIAFVPYCVNSPDIVGAPLRYLFDEGGLLGVANIILIGCSIYVFIQNARASLSKS